MIGAHALTFAWRQARHYAGTTLAPCRALCLLTTLYIIQGFRILPGFEPAWSPHGRSVINNDCLWHNPEAMVSAECHQNPSTSLSFVDI